MDDGIIETEKKKRGRKKKIVETENEVDEKNIEIKKKRGRKPRFVYSTTQQVNQSFMSDDENIIVKLNITDENNDLNNNEDNNPCAYNTDVYYNIHDIKENSIDESNENNLKVVNILQDFEEKNKINEWPLNTSIHCYWCCNRFDNAPFGIPVNYLNGNFNVYGCFCSLECAAAYNFKTNDNIDESWERYNLINLLSNKLNIDRIIKPAPDKLSLKTFGGYLTIEEFRQYFKSNKVININFPPMISLTQQIEEINDYEMCNDYKYIPIDQDRIDKYKNKVLFKRNKPIVNKNSLESTMNLKYN